MARAVFATTIEIPVSTTWSDPYEKELELPAGYIIEWFIQGAPEHQHQVSLSIYYMGHRVFPDGEIEVFYSSEFPGNFKVYTEIVEGRRAVSLKGANDDDTYEHAIYIAATVEILGEGEMSLSGGGFPIPTPGVSPY